MNIFKNLSKIILITAITACTPHWYKPMGYRAFSRMPKGGSPGFRLGWLHGCESGLGTQFGGAIYQSFYSWHRDIDITSSNPDVNKIRVRYRSELKGIDWNNQKEVNSNFSDYNTIFWGAHYFCRQFVLGTVQSAALTAPLPGETRYDPGVHSIGNVWKINGRGDTRIGATNASNSLW